MEVTLSKEQVYCLALEYRDKAQSQVSSIKNETQCQQYYTLISMSIRCWQYLLEHFHLPINEEAECYIAIIKLLLSETSNWELAEIYLAEITSKLTHLSGSLDVRKWQMQLEFISLYELPMLRNTAYHYRVAMRHCDDLILSIEKLQNKAWLSVFLYVSLTLRMQVGLIKQSSTIFDELVSNLKWTSEQKYQVHEKWEAMTLLQYLTFMLAKRQPIRKRDVDMLKELRLQDIGVKLYSWKLVLLLLDQIHRDVNISDILNEFKILFRDHKTELDGKLLKIHVMEGMCVNVTLPSVFEYQHLKKLLLLLQSVSFLMNSHDSKANFSTKFLPKLMNQLHNDQNSIPVRGSKSLHEIDNDYDWLDKMLQLTALYKEWERIILNGKLDNSENKLVHAITLQLNGLIPEAYAEYTAISGSSAQFHQEEMRLSALLNMFVLSQNLKQKESDSTSYIVRSNDIWNQVEKIMRKTTLKDNNVWDCTVLIVWVMTHCLPFSKDPLPSIETERNEKLQALALYYKNKKPVKKSLLLHILLKYIGARQWEQDLPKICEVSKGCLQMCERLGQNSNSFHNLEYVVGLWHLMNSTKAMDQKEVLMTKKKLEKLSETDKTRFNDT